jgi:hypothetical protein
LQLVNFWKNIAYQSQFMILTAQDLKVGLQSVLKMLLMSGIVTPLEMHRLFAKELTVIKIV